MQQLFGTFFMFRADYISKLCVSDIFKVVEPNRLYPFAPSFIDTPAPTDTVDARSPPDRR